MKEQGHYIFVQRLAALLAVLAFLCPASSRAADVSFDQDTPVPLTSPAITLTVRAGSVANVLTVNAGSVVVTVPAGSVFRIASSDRDLVAVATVSSGNVTTTCGTGNVATVTVNVIGAAETVTITPLAAPCSVSTGGGFSSPMQLTIASERIASSTDTTATVSWSTNVPGTSRVVYDTVPHPQLGTAPNYGYASSTTVDASSTTSHAVIVRDLTPGGTYYLRPVSASPEFTGVELRVTLSGAVTVTEPVAPAASAPPPVAAERVAAVVAAEKTLVTAVDQKLLNRLRGRLLLQVQSHGEAWYLEPVSSQKHYLADGAAAYTAMRRFGLGVTNADLALIPVGWRSNSGSDGDADGLPDAFEEALGTNISAADTDGDGYADDVEVRNGYNPLGAGRPRTNTALQERLRGRILLQVQSHGQAWYVNPVDGKRYYLGNAAAAYELMRGLGLGITNTDLRRIPVGE